MLTFRNPIPAIVVGVLLLLVSGPRAFALGSQVGHDDPWNPEHIDHLPPEIRNAVTHMCGNSPRAAHYFVTYLNHAQIIKLHFEHLHCGEAGGFCRGDNCLHQEYVSKGGQYRLIKSYYGRDND
ncbi:hypothetical protein [Bradyrhizobium sp. Cp5.3]|uniref:hypothetical protein n=1 Tax=Bradyrhizobium sp. Cp5.3 TaxID=443598 RepID=UPI00041D9239|nr:hypothetical protein [Bradyrhizobium sp. Cp5.3]